MRYEPATHIPDQLPLANPEGQTSITGTARFVPATFYIASLPFQDTPPNGGYLRARSRPALVTMRDSVSDEA